MSDPLDLSQDDYQELLDLANSLSVDLDSSFLQGTPSTSVFDTSLNTSSFITGVEDRLHQSLLRVVADNTHESPAFARELSAELRSAFSRGIRETRRPSNPSTRRSRSFTRFESRESPILVTRSDSSNSVSPSLDRSSLSLTGGATTLPALNLHGIRAHTHRPERRGRSLTNRRFTFGGDTDTTASPSTHPPPLAVDTSLPDTPPPPPVETPRL